MVYKRQTLFFVRQRDAALGALDLEHARSEELLLNVLPAAIAERLKREPGVIAQAHPSVTVLFADVAGFTPFVERTSPEAVIDLLDRVFSAFDELADRYDLEKIKTIGDAYMVVGGAPKPRPDHTDAVASMALDMLDAIRDMAIPDLAVRIGIDTGPVIAGVIGRRKFSYDLWGDTVNTASRMESTGIAGRIQVTPAVEAQLRDRFRFEPRGPIDIKGKGELATFFLIGRIES
jgi:adenylate cyclase